MTEQEVEDLSNLISEAKAVGANLLDAAAARSGRITSDPVAQRLIQAADIISRLTVMHVDAYAAEVNAMLLKLALQKKVDQGANADYHRCRNDEPLLMNEADQSVDFKE